MTKRFSILAALLLLATSAFAQKAAISVFVANPGGGWSNNQGTTYNGDFGLGAEYWFTPGVSAAVNVSRHSDGVSPTIYNNHVYEYPIDALLRYRFPGNDRWKPYLGGGIRTVRGYGAFSSRTWDVAGELNGGVTFLISKKLGLDLDGKVVPSQSHYTGVDKKRVSFGLSWHF